MADRRTYRTFGLLDIGTSKTVAAVMVAEHGPSLSEPSLRLAGLGLQRSRGVKAGVLTDLDEAESVVRTVLAQAERAAGVSVGNYTVSVAAGRLASAHCTARIDVETGRVTLDDIGRLMTAKAMPNVTAARCFISTDSVTSLMASAACATQSGSLRADFRRDCMR